jgi:hypothetical protein
MTFARKSDNFPPEQVKEVIGQLSVATARSTEPANKLSLTSSRIATLTGVMDYKCKEYLMPGLSTILYDTIFAMVSDMATDNPDANLQKTLAALEAKLQAIIAEQTSTKSKYMVDESLELLRDYNVVIDCRSRWKVANAWYMTGEAGYGTSNAILSDIHDALSKIEMKYNLIIMPKHYSFDVNDLSMLSRKDSNGVDKP